jgi:CheY-like chemotaxis protein
VDLHGGSIVAESKGEGEGSTFTITLPAYTEPIVASTAVMHADPAPSLQGVRILIVDDDPDSLAVLENTFSEHGAKVIEAHSAAEALQVISGDRPDLLVSDIGMPGQDGYQLMLTIAAAEKGKPPLPAIALTGYASQKDRERALAVGYRIHMAKPFEPSEIVRAAEQLLPDRTNRINSTTDVRK